MVYCNSTLLGADTQTLRALLSLCPCQDIPFLVARRSVYKLCVDQKTEAKISLCWMLQGEQHLGEKNAK